MTTALQLDPQLQWLWYSNATTSFIVGDGRAAFAVSIDKPGVATPLAAAPASQAESFDQHPCNLPISTSMYDEFAGESWHGFRFLERSAYDQAKDARGYFVGDLLRTLVFGPNYGHYVLHPASGAIMALKSGSMQLLERTAEGFKVLDDTKTRGRAALAFAAHPTEPLIVYGDNYGTFHAHRFKPNEFGKAGKFAAKERKASRLEFIRGGQMLAIGGMGYLATYSYANGKLALLRETSMSVRDFKWLGAEDVVLVNQGLHGVTAYRYDSNGFTKLGGFNPGGAVQQMAVSKCERYLAITDQQSSNLSVYSVTRE